MSRQESANTATSRHQRALSSLISNIKTFSLPSYVSINAESLRSLQILASETQSNHNIYALDQSSDISKSSFTLFGLFGNFISTPQGRVHLCKLILRPISAIEDIQRRQEAVSMLLHPENRDKTQHTIRMLRKVRNICVPLDSLRRGVDCSASNHTLGKSVWKSIQGFTSYVLRLRETVMTLVCPKTIPIVVKVSRGDFVLDAIEPANWCVTSLTPS